MAREISFQHEYDLKAQLNGNMEINDITGRFVYKGEVESYADLPTSQMCPGDLYRAHDTGIQYYWDDATQQWAVFGTSTVTVPVDPAIDGSSPNPVENRAIKEYIDNMLPVAPIEVPAAPKLYKIGFDATGRIISFEPAYTETLRFTLRDGSQVYKEVVLNS